MNPLFVTVLACVFTGNALAAYIDEACANSGECTVTNSYCYKTFSNCDKGECQCKSGYYEEDTQTCLKERGIGETCSSSTHCLYGATCNSGTSKCACTSGEEYNSKLKLCVTSGLKAITEECSSDSNCYGSSTMVECHGTSTKTCKCKTGYITDAYTCRLPHVTEDCKVSPGCAEQVDVGTGQETETCDTNDLKCKCPSTADRVSAVAEGVTYRLCYSKYSLLVRDQRSCYSNFVTLP
ncbi:stabilin-2-like [Mercenaria mercenaria]|uniref:stabilin-2-like n=1 Tax=Mercenaria mercenaria TaxID=6596 RepID=UPI00234F2D2F|nr:stabilin-2-like [Mercenaria mercenaria]